MRTEKELDFLEKKITELAGSATKKAYIDALSRGCSVTAIVEGQIVSIAPDGTRTLIKKAKPMVKIHNHD